MSVLLHLQLHTAPLLLACKSCLLGCAKPYPPQGSPYDPSIRGSHHRLSPPVILPNPLTCIMVNCDTMGFSPPSRWSINAAVRYAPLLLSSQDPRLLSHAIQRLPLQLFLASCEPCYTTWVIGRGLRGRLGAESLSHTVRWRFGRYFVRRFESVITVS